ncbi:MAG TPA: hypothetical protein VHG33_07445 [Woeseiaceae bacterium]|nr:hypothetical protein [Woeseiaceae bacterium]
MMLKRTLDLPGRLPAPAALALLTIGAALPAEAQVNALTGSGLYDFLIPTNCFALSEQADTRTPYWLSDGTYPDNRVPLLATGNARGIVRTVDLADQVSFHSSNPRVIPAPAKIQAVGAIGGVNYQPSDVWFTVKAPSRPTNVDITAQGSVNSVIGAVAQLGQAKRVTRKFRVYPPQKISKATIGPEKPAPYADGERLRIDVALPWKIPVSTATVVIGQPVYKDRNGRDVRARLPEWKAGSTYTAKRIAVPPNGNKVSFDFVARFPSDAASERLGPMLLKTSFVVPVQLTTENHVPCTGLVTNPKSAQVGYTMQRRMDVSLQAKPATSLPAPIQQAPLPRPATGSGGGVPAPRDPLPSRPDPEPEGYPKPKPGIRQ